MSEWGEYIVKVNLALAAFYLLYRFIFRNDTFFGLKRFFLLLVYFVSFLYPLADLSGWLAQQDNASALLRLYKTVLMPSLHTAEPVLNGAEPLGAGISPAVRQQVYVAEPTRMVGAGIYLAGVVVLSARCLIEMLSLACLLMKCRTTRIAGRRVHLLPRQEESFSFFGFIFIDPSVSGSEDAEKIVLHENIHARQLHSADVLAGELVRIVCWFNPFVWLLKREMALNHEYLADRTVVKEGIDRKAYQYCLIGKPHGSYKAAANLYNHFNVLLLKKRIVMLNKKRTRRIGQLRYLMFVPLAGALLLAGNVDAAARMAARIAAVPATPSLSIDFPAAPAVKDTAKVVQEKAGQTEEPVFTIVEKMPKLSTGESVEKFVSKNLKYPPTAIEEKLEGRVVVSFIVNADGTVSDIKVVRSVAPVLDNEAIRVIKSLPKFTPGSQRGKNVRVKITCLAAFKLQENQKKATQPTGN